jgi:hypothetical protein
MSIITPNNDFSIGDEVLCRLPYDGNHNVVGKIGKIITVGGGHYVSVEFSVEIGGHSGVHYNGRQGHCWNFPIVGEKYLIPAKSINFVDVEMATVPYRNKDIVLIAGKRVKHKLLTPRALLMKTHYETWWKNGVSVKMLVVNCGDGLDKGDQTKSIKLDTYYPLNKIYKFLREGQIIATNGDGSIVTHNGKFFTATVKKVVIDGSDVDIYLDRHDKVPGCIKEGESFVYWLLSLCSGDEKIQGKDNPIQLAILDKA